MTKKALLISVLVAVILLATVGATYAYFTTFTTGTNVVTIGNVKIKATLVADPGVKEIVPGRPFAVRGLTVENLGSNPAFLRVQLRPGAAADLAKFTQLKVIAQTPGNMDATSVDANGSWYYYKVAVAPKASVTFTGEAILDKAVNPKDMPSAQLQYFVEAIQSEHIAVNGTGYPQWPNVDIIKAN